MSSRRIKKFWWGWQLLISQLYLSHGCIFIVDWNKKLLCPNGRKKSHCMLARRAACSQLRLRDAIRRNVHTARHLTARCKLRARVQCDCFHQFGYKTSCVPQATWWRYDSCEYTKQKCVKFRAHLLLRLKLFRIG